MKRLLEAPDAEFDREWREMTDDERGALPDGVRSQCYDRYRRLNTHVAATSERLRREQVSRETAPTPIEEVATPQIKGAMAYYEAVDALWEAGLPPGDKTGWKSLDRHYTVAPGQMTIITGWPGSGKSEFLDQLLVNLAAQGWKFAVFSAENLPVELHLSKLIEKLSGMPFGDGPNPRVPREDLSEYMDELALSFRFITAPSGGATLREIMRRAHDWLTLVNDRKPGLVIDPWNELEHSRPRNMTETEYISESLSYLRNWARVNGVHVWVVAHPAKQPRDDGALPLPKPDMISGSQHWWNKADAAITVHRTTSDEGSVNASQTEIHITKIRFKNIGKIGMVALRYDRINGRYSE